MSSDFHIDRLLHEWPYDPTRIMVRMVEGEDGRDVIQLRVEMGILQLETEGRPDGTRPEAAETYYQYLMAQVSEQSDFELSEHQCAECDREFVQFYHRRICWLALQRYAEAVCDADHTLGLMDFCRQYSDDESWTGSHEQYRPFVMYHRIQAHAMAEVLSGEHETAVQSINLGLDALRGIYANDYSEVDFEQDELVVRLTELRESLRNQFEVGRTLQERLGDAIQAEQYELAARLRDELDARSHRH